MTKPTTDSAAKRERVVLWPLVALSLLSIPIIFWGLGSASLAHGDEGFYQLVARNMLETGDWSRLEFTGEHRSYDTLLNAPIHYWAKAVLIWCFGDNYWTMRLISAVFGLLSVLATYRLTSYVSNRTAGFLAGLLLLTTYQFIHYHGARVGVLEPIVTFCLVMTVDTFLRALDRDKNFIAHNIYLIALVNLKSPLLVVPVAAELLYFAITPGTRRRLVGWSLTGLAMLPLGLAWHGYQYFRLGHEQFWEAVDKITGKASGETVPREDIGVAHHARYYGETMLFGAFPYVLAAPLAIVGLIGSSAPSAQRRRERMLLLAPACLLAFFVIISKYYSWYMIPLYPFFAAIVAIWLARLPKMKRVALPIGAAAVLAALMVVLRLDVLDMNPYATRRMDVTVASIGDLPPWIVFSGAAVAIASLLALLRLVLKQNFAPVLAWGLAGVLIGYGGVRVLAPLRFVGHQSPMAELRRQIDAELAAGRKLDFPIPVTEAGNPKVRFYFGSEFVIRKVDRDDAFYELIREGITPANPNRSGIYYNPRDKRPEARSADRSVDEEEDVRPRLNSRRNRSPNQGDRQGEP